MRKKISTDTGKNRKYIFSTVSIIMGLQILLFGNYFFGVVFLVIGVLLFKYSKSGGYICFDQNFMFVVSKTHEKRISLKKITKITKPMIQVGNSRNNWDIYYRNNQDEILKERISPSFYKSNFKEFKNLVKVHNPSVKS
tara:strand:+ start:946 stop:1362 length:417 start_codon:yes stop_codon:yes gene_type:complete